jgi:hypothetical protein
MASCNTASRVVKQINSFPSVIDLFTLRTTLAIAMKLREGIDVSQASKSTKILSVSMHHLKVNSALRTLLCGRCQSSSALRLNQERLTMRLGFGSHRRFYISPPFAMTDVARGLRHEVQMPSSLACLIFILAPDSLIGPPTPRSSFAKVLKPSPRYRQPAHLPFRPHELHMTILKRRLADMKAGRSSNWMDLRTVINSTSLSLSQPPPPADRTSTHLTPASRPPSSPNIHNTTPPQSESRRYMRSEVSLQSCQCCTNKSKTYLVSLDFEQRAKHTVEGGMHIPRTTTDALRLPRHISINDNYRLEF